MLGKKGSGSAESLNPRPSAVSRDADRAEQGWKRVFEMVEWLERPGARTSVKSARSGPRLQAVVIDPGLPSPHTIRQLQAFREQFPHVAIVTPRAEGADARRGNFDGIVGAYAASRGLSPRQRRILDLHLSGKHDKEIASDLGCELTTIYEHWRRMARKVGGSRKSELVADFHQHLASRSTPERNDGDSAESSAWSGLL